MHRGLLILAIFAAIPAFSERVLLVDSRTGRTRNAPDRVRVIDLSNLDERKEWRQRADTVMPAQFPAYVDTRWGAWIHATGQWAQIKARLGELKPDNTAQPEYKTARQDLRQARNQMGLPNDASITDIRTAAIAGATNNAGDRRLARVLAAEIVLMQRELERLGGRVEALEDDE